MKYTTLSIIGLFAFSSTLINCTTSDDDGSTGGTGGAGANGGTAGTGNGGTAGTGNGGTAGTGNGGTAGTGNGGTAGTGNGGTAGTGNGGTGAGGTGGGGDCQDGGTGDCQTCQQTAQSAGGCCESEANACGAEQDCIDFDDCLTPCFDGQGNADQACIQQCVTDHQTGAGIYQTLLTCVLGDGQSTVGACGNACQ